MLTEESFADICEHGVSISMLSNKQTILIRKTLLCRKVFRVISAKLFYKGLFYGILSARGSGSNDSKADVY